MDDGQKSIHFVIGKLHITIFNKWQRLEYANREGAAGWYLLLGFIELWGRKLVKL